MINHKNVLKSSKAVGKYEKPLIRRLKAFFEMKGYQVVPHASLNISWGIITSDIDLLLIKDNELTAIEVKSRKDRLDRANKQIENVCDFVDYAYVAAERNSLKPSMRETGIIVVNEEGIKIVKEAGAIHKVPDFRSFSRLHKKCLVRLVDQEGNPKVKKIGKFELAQDCESIIEKQSRKSNLKEIVTCGQHCSKNCPIWHFEHTGRGLL